MNIIWLKEPNYFSFDTFHICDRILGGDDMKNIKFMKAMWADRGDIYHLIERAKESLKRDCIDQWQNGYPDMQVVEDDILNKQCFVVKKTTKVIASVVIIVGIEKNYCNIYEGKWKNDGDYATIHRIVIDEAYQHSEVSKFLMEEIKRYCKNYVNRILVDTHEENMRMIKFLLHNAFDYCGIIYLENGDKRVGYEYNFNEIKHEME